MEQHTKRARIADVARAAGVSKAAASFAFNKPDRLSGRDGGADPGRWRRSWATARTRSRGCSTPRQTATIGILSPPAPWG